MDEDEYMDDYEEEDEFEDEEEEDVGYEDKDKDPLYRAMGIRSQR